jgi:hypothetical protein
MDDPELESAFDKALGVRTKGLLGIGIAFGTALAVGIWLGSQWEGYNSIKQKTGGCLNEENCLQMRADIKELTNWKLVVERRFIDIENKLTAAAQIDATALQRRIERLEDSKVLPFIWPSPLPGATIKELEARMDALEKTTKSQ